MNDTPDLNALMSECAKGDHTAFRTLATVMGSRMFALAYRLMGYNRAAAEDAVQDALIKLWVNAPKWQPSGRIEAYISTIVHHCCMDLHRKNHGGSDELPEELPSTSTTASNNVFEKQRHILLMSGINALPARQREALLLSYFGENSNRQIATTLKISEKAVESLLVRARRTLAQTLPADLKEGEML